MYLHLERGELQNQIEEDTKGFAEKTIPASPGRDDLKKANDYNPAFFGGLFPQMGVDVTSSPGRSRYKDKPNRPGRVNLTLYIYDVAMPERGARRSEEDKTSRAKKNTRRIRDLILKEMFEDPNYAAHAEITDNRSSIYNDFGFPMLDVVGSNILWVDRTDIAISGL